MDAVAFLVVVVVDLGGCFVGIVIIFVTVFLVVPMEPVTSSFWSRCLRRASCPCFLRSFWSRCCLNHCLFQMNCCPARSCPAAKMCCHCLMDHHFLVLSMLLWSCLPVLSCQCCCCLCCRRHRERPIKRSTVLTTCAFYEPPSNRFH